MRIGELADGAAFRTRLTKRAGEVLGHNERQGVMVRWLEGREGFGYICPDVQVDPTPGRATEGGTGG